MRVDRLLTNVAQLVTPAGTGARRGHQMRTLTVIPDAVIAIHAGLIVWCGPRREWGGSTDDEVDAHGCAVIPGLVDPHTHTVWGGDRLADFDARASGVSYEAILANGGGIRHTVAETRRCSDAALLSTAIARVGHMMRAGATTIEIKSGYGLTRRDELRQLGTIRMLASHVPAQLSATMLFHLPPTNEAERAAFLHEAVHEWIPQIASDGTATAIDVFIEREAFTLGEADLLFRAARQVGLACKAHADQFSAMGATELAISHGALSVDHLEASGPTQIDALAGSSTVGVVLPGVTLHLGLPAAPGRALVERPLSGLALEAVARAGKAAFREALLFTHRGLSGPAILQASSYWREGEALTLDLVPERDAAALLLAGKRARPKAEPKTILAELLPQRLAQAMAAQHLPPRVIGEVGDADLRKLGALLKAWALKPSGTEGYAKAEVTLGGVDTQALSSQSMMAKEVPGLFVIGEAVDVTGWLGGYNFQWAWSSGWAAGEHA